MMKQNRSILQEFRGIFALTFFLLAFVFGYEKIESRLYSIWFTEVGLVAHYSLPKLFFEFLYISLISSLLSVFLGIMIGVFCHTKIGISFKIIIEKLSILIQTIPTMAILMFAIVLFGFGARSAILALLVQSILPIVFATITGLSNISEHYIDAARGLGLNESQILFKIKFPLAFPVILSGIRTSTIICISTATLAFSTGAGGLGLLIQTGLATYNTVFLFEGTLPICLMAIIADKTLMKLEKRF